MPYQTFLNNQTFVSLYPLFWTMNTVYWSHQKKGAVMDYKKEIISIINSIEDSGRLSYIYTFLLWLTKEWWGD
jgi:hypothetical protein